MNLVGLFSSVVLLMNPLLGREAHSTDWPRIPKSVCEQRIFGDPLDLRATGAEGIAILVRVLDGCGLDRQLKLVQRRDEAPLLTASTTLNGSIQEQLERTRKSRPDLGFDEACRAVEIKEFFKNEVRSKRLRREIDLFRSIVMHPAINAPLVLDGAHYRVWVFSAPSNYSYFDFFGSGDDSARNNPLQAWVDRLVELAGMKCRRS